MSRRLPPLRLGDPPQPASPDPAPTQPRVEVPLAHGPGPPRRALWPWIAGGGVALTVAAVGGGGFLLGRATPGEAAAPSTAAPLGPTAAPISAPSSWTDALDDATCSAPCCGGAACAVDADNARDYAPFCRPGTPACAPCSTGIRCIPGTCAEELATGEVWDLRPSGVLSRPSGGRMVSFCEAQAPLRVCIRTSKNLTQCWGHAEVCAGRGEPLRVETEDLTRRGLTVEVQDAAGRVLASRHRTFTDGMRRRGLCTGFAMKDLEPRGSPFDEVTFWLAPP